MESNHEEEKSTENKMVIFRNLTNVKFQQLRNAISKDKKRPHLLGVFLDLKNEKLVVTNTKILVAYDIDMIHQDSGLKEILIDPKIFNQSNWLSVPKEDLSLVEFYVTEEKTEVRLGEDVVAVAKNIDTENAFPQWKHAFVDSEETNLFSASAENLKLLLSAIPPAFGYPKFKVGKKFLFQSEYESEEFGNIEIIGLSMTVGFGEDEVTNETIEVKINRDKDGRVFSGEFKKVDGKKLSRRVIKSWDEDFIDEDSGEVVTIPRNEVIVDKNTIIDAEVFERISAVKEIDYLFIHKYDN